MPSRRLKLICLISILGLIPIWVSGQEPVVPPLINYQGKLTATGQSLPTGDYTLSFSIYDKPMAAPCTSTTETDCTRLIWGPQVFDGRSDVVGHGAQVPVVKGFFNVILGPYDTDGDLIAGAFLSADRFVEVTVEGDGPVLPRQQVYSVPFALTSLQGGLPIGGLTMFSGNPDNLPENWRLCNGQQVNDEASPFHGEHLPDLRGKFVRGAANPRMVGVIGGRDRRDTHIHRFSGSLNIPRRSLNGYLSNRIVGGWRNVFGDIDWHGRRDAIAVGRRDREDIKDSHGHTGTVEGSTSSDRQTNFDNRPRHINLHYIIRIK